MQLAMSVEQPPCPPFNAISAVIGDCLLERYCTEELKRRRSQPSDTADAFGRFTACLVALKQVANQATE